jgi:nucleotide-binding universal stress UspA family protein
MESGAEPAGDTLVVGYDGSDCARMAVEYAGKRAGPNGKVFVVNAYGPPHDWLGHREYDRIVADHQSRGRELLEALMADRASLPETTYETELLEGPAADAIARVAEIRGASEVVVGSRGAGRVRRVLGTVSHDLLHSAKCPVVVIAPPEGHSP